MRRFATALLVLGTVLPLLPLLVWSFSSSWRYPAMVPKQATNRGLSTVVSSEVLGALGTSTLIASSVAVLAGVSPLSRCWVVFVLVRGGFGLTGCIT